MHVRLLGIKRVNWQRFCMSILGGGGEGEGQGEGKTEGGVHPRVFAFDKSERRLEVLEKVGLRRGHTERGGESASVVVVFMTHLYF